MKRVYLLLLMVCIAFGAMAQNEDISGYLDERAESKGYSSVYISPSMMKLMRDMKLETAELKRAIEVLNAVQILTFDDGGESSSKAEFKAVTSKLSALKLEELMYVKEDGKETKFMIRKKGELISSMVMVTNVKSTTVAIHLDGLFTLEDLKELSNSLNIGMDALDDIKGLK